MNNKTVLYGVFWISLFLSTSFSVVAQTTDKAPNIDFLKAGLPDSITLGGNPGFQIQSTPACYDDGGGTCNTGTDETTCGLLGGEWCPNGCTVGTGPGSGCNTGDSDPPTFNSAGSTPVDDATNVAIADNIVVDFSENITGSGGTGNITLRTVSPAADVETFAITGVGTGTSPVGGAISIDGDKLYINPTNNLSVATEYAIQIASTAIDDSAANDFAGIADDTTFSFTTVNSAPTATITSAPDVSAAGASTYVVTVSYNDTDGTIAASSIGTDDIAMSPALTLASRNIDSGEDGATTVVSYTFTPPGGTWDSADNNTYTISTGSGVVQDNLGSSVASIAGGTPGTSFTVAIPEVDSAAYNATAGTLTLTTANVADSDTIIATTITLTGEGGATYTLTDTSNATVTTNSAPFTLSATDKAAVNLIMNNTGTSSTGSTTYNLNAATNWTSSEPADTTNAVTVSSITDPSVSAVTYNTGTGVLAVTGSDFVRSGSAADSNDVDISTLTITGQGGGGSAYTVTSATDVDVTNGTSFSITLAGSDKTSVDALLNANGTSSGDATTYNIAFADNWMAGAISGNNIALATNGITVSGVNNVPTISVDGNPTYNETGPVTLDASVTIADGNGEADLQDGYISFAITGNNTANDTLTLVQSGGLSISGTDVSISGTGVVGTLSASNGGVVSNNTVLQIDFNSNITAAHAQTIAQAIQFDTSADAPGSDRTVTFTINDGIADGTDTATVTISALAADSTNAADFNTTTGAGLTTGLLFDGSGETLTISDATHITSSTNAVANGGDGTDTLVIAASVSADLTDTNLNITSFENLTLNDGATATLTEAQHDTFSANAITGGAMTESIILDTPVDTPTSAVTGDADIEAYTLNGAFTYTLPSGATSQSITGSDGASQTINIGGLTMTSSAALHGGAGQTDVLQMGNSSSISSITSMNLSGFEQLTVDDGATATMTELQHDGFGAITDGGTGTITLSNSDGDDTLTGDADINAYELNDAFTFTLGAAGQSVTGEAATNQTVASSASIDTLTGTLDGGTGGSDQFNLDDGDDITGANVSGFETVSITDGATVSLTLTQHDGFTFSATGTQTISLSGNNDFDTNTAIEAYNVQDDASDSRTVTVKAAGTSVTDQSANSGDNVVTVDLEALTYTGTVTGAGSNDVILLSGNADVSGGTFNSVTAMTINNGTSVIMTEAQHDAFTFSATGTETVTIDLAGGTTSGTMTADAAIANYTLTDAMNLTLAANSQSVTASGTNNDTINVSTFTAGTTLDGGDGTDTLEIANGGSTASTTTLQNFENLTITTGANVTVNMLASQLADFSGGSITAAGADDTVNLSGDGAVSTLNSAAIENYSIQDDSSTARTVTLGNNDTATNISAQSGSDAITFSVPGITYTGALVGEGTTNDTLLLANSANVSGGTLSNIEVLSMASGASVTLSAGQYSAITNQAIVAPGTGGSGETITINGTGDITVNATTVETYTIEDDSSESRTITLGSANSNTFTANSASDAITFDISTFNFTGAFTADATVANTLVSDGSNAISSASPFTGFANLTLDGTTNDLSLTPTQLNAFSGTITATGTDTLRFAETGSVTGGNLAAIENFATTGSGSSLVVTMSATDVNGKTLSVNDATNHSFTINGATGAQTINGSAGGDTLSGGDGADTINPGAGTDSMSGGNGNDIFSGSSTDLNGDTITDLEAGDTIKITGVTGLTTSNVRFNGSGTLQIDTDATTFAAVEVALNLSNSAGDNLNILNVVDNGGDTDITFESSNDLATFSNLSTSSPVAYTENAAAVTLDSDVTVSDTELDALNTPNGNYSGTTLTISRNGTANANDVFSADSTSSLASLDAGTLTFGGTNYGTVANTGGTLTLTFNANAPTRATINSIMQAIQYSNSSEAPASSVTLDWVFNDGVGNSTVTTSTQSLINITAVNDAPALNATQSPILTAIDEDAGNDDDSGADGDDDATNNSNNPGTDVATIIVDGSITDDDGSAVEAIAVVTVDNTNGLWQYSTDNGTNWVNFSGTTAQSVSIATSARLLDGTLTGASTHKIRFVPSQNYNGSATFTFRAWDKTSGSVGSTADTSTNGDTTAFSSTTDTAAITVNAINDTPVLGTNTGVTVERGSNLVIGSSALATTDNEDSADNITYTVTAVPTKGALQKSDGTTFSSLSDSDTFTQEDINNSRLRYVHAGAVNTTDSFSFSVADSNSASVTGQSVSITIQDTTAPTITSVSISNSAHKVGDTVAVTIIVASDSDNYTSGSGTINGTIAGYALGGLSRVSDTQYTATFTISDNGTDVAAGSDVPVSIVLRDSSGNGNTAFTTAISQSGDAIYANLPTVTLSTNNTTIAEDAGVATVTATLSGSLNNTWPEDVGLQLGFGGTATNTTDYTRSSSSLTISTGSTSNAITITSVADTIYDALSNETVTVSIDCIIASSAVAAASNQQTITITDAQSAPAVTLAVDNATINENGGTTTPSVTLSNATFEAVTINLGYTGTATAASSGADYNNTASTSITVSQGDTSATAATVITSVDDSDSEGPETIIIDVTGVSGGGATEATEQQQTVNITDDDNTAPVMTDLVSSLTINEDTLTNLGLSDTTFTDDQNDSLTVTLAVNSGTLSSPLGSSGDVTVSGADSASMTLTGLPANLNTFLDNANAVAITPAENSTSAITLTVTPNDGTVDGTVGNTTINITPINDAPSLNTNGSGGDLRLWRTSANTGGNLGGRTGADSFCDGDANKPTVASSQTRAFISVSDSDEIRDMATLYSIPTSSAIFRLDGTTQIAPDFAALLDAGTTALTNSVNGVGGIAGAAFTGTNGDGSLNTNNCSGWTTASTGNGMSGLGNSTNGGYLETGVTGCGNTTVIGLFCLTYAEGQVTIALSMDEDASAQSIFSSAQISDVDSPSATFTLTLTLSDTTAGTLGGTASGSAQLNVNDGTLTLSGTLTDVNASLASITYTPAENYNGSDATLSVTVTDGTSTSSAINGSITVTAVNDAPTVDTNAGVTVNEGGTAVLTATQLNASDVDDSGTGLTFTVTTATTNGTLFLDADDDDTADSGETLSASSTFTQADLSAGNVQYTHNGDETTSDSFVFSLADGGEDSVSELTGQTFNISVTSVNEVPVITSTEVTAATEDSAYSYTLTATDVDTGDSLTLAAPTLPSWLTFTASSGVLSGTPVNDDVGSHNVVLTATDTGNLAVTQSFTITVANTNDAPVITSSAVTSVAEDSAYSYTLTASDVDAGDTVTLAAATLPDWLSFNATTGVLSGTPTNDEVGTHSVVLTASDTSSATDTQSFTITVSNTNDAPVISGVPASQVTVGQAYSFAPTVSDDDNDSLQYSTQNLPSFLRIDSGSGGIDGTPTRSDVGTYSNIIVSVSDGTVTVSLDAFELEVVDSNVAPVIDQGASTSVNMSEDGSPDAFALTLSATDDNGDDLTWSVSDASLGSVSVNSGGVVSYTPDADVSGTDGFSVTVSDGSLTDDIAVTVNIAAVNDAPVISGTPTTSVSIGTAYNFEPTATDVDSDNLTFSINSTPSWASFNSANGALTGTPTGNDVGESDPIVISVSDGDESVSLDAFTIEVVDPDVNVAPTVADVAATTDEDVAADITLLGVDANDDTLTYSVVSAPANGEVTVSGNVATYTPTADFNGEDSFTYIANDGVLDSEDAATVTITLTPVNDAPTISGEPASQVAFGSEYTFEPDASDVDGDTLSFSEDNLPGWLTLNSETGAISGTPSEEDLGTFDNIVITVSDDELSSSLATFSIEVVDPAANNAPVAQGSEVSTDEDTQLTITLSATDEDGDQLTYTIEQQPASGSLALDENQEEGNVYIYTPNENVGDVQDSLTFFANDGVEDSNVATVSISIVAVNDAPVITGEPATTVRVGQTYSFTPQFSDIDSDSLTLSVSNLPRWATFDEADGTLSGSPGESDVTTYSDVTIVVSDGELSAELVFNITVQENVPPEISGANQQQVQVGESYSFTPTVVNSDDDTLSFTIDNPPVWASFQFDTTSGTMTGQPTADDIGVTTGISITVSDGISNATLNLSDITVCEVCDPEAPVIGGNPVTDIIEGESYSFTPTASDANNDIVAFDIVNQPAWADFDTTSGVLSGVAVAGTYSDIQVSVVDSTDLSATLDAFTIVVTAINNPPVVTGTPPSQVDQNAAYSFTPSSISDPEGETVEFTLRNGPSWLLVNRFSGSLSGTPGSADVGTASGIELVASDSVNETVVGPFSITVNAFNTAPEFTNSAPRSSLSAGSAYSFTFAATDVDTSDVLTFGVSGQPDWLSMDSASGTLAGTAPDDFSGDTGEIQVTVSDGTNTVSYPAFTLTVNAVNSAPVASNVERSGVEDSVILVAASVIDPDNDILTITTVSQPANGTLVELVGGWQYTPNSNFNGADTFTYEASDGSATSEVATVTMNVSPENDDPVAGNDTLSDVQNADGSYVLDVLANDTDIDGDTLGISLITANLNNVTMGVNGSGQIALTVPAQFTGNISFNYSISDGSDGSDSANVTFVIEPNDTATQPPVIAGIEDINVDADALQTVVNLGAVTATDASGNDVAVEISGSTATDINQRIFRPGNNTVTWNATDDFGNQTTAVQNVNVRPLVNFSEDESVEEGTEVSVVLTLNGDAVQYPYTVNYSVSGTADSQDHTLADGTVVFTDESVTARTQQTLAFSVLQDDVSESDESIVLTLASTDNPGESADITITISALNQPPRIVATTGYSVTGNLGTDPGAGFGFFNNFNQVNVESGDALGYSLGAAGLVFLTTDATNTQTTVVINTLEVEIFSWDVTWQRSPFPFFNPTFTATLTGSPSSYDFDALSSSIYFNTMPNGILNNLSNFGRFTANNFVGSLVFVPYAEIQRAFFGSFAPRSARSLVARVGRNEIDLITADGFTVDSDALQPLTNTSNVRLTLDAADQTELATDTDSDGDQIPDSEEGFQDTDNDGIPDYLDAVNECNVLPHNVENQTLFVAESDADVCLQLGDIVRANQIVGIRIDDATPTLTLEDADITNVGGSYDFIMTDLPEVGVSPNIVIGQVSPIPANAVFRIYREQSGEWRDFSVNDSNDLFSAAGAEGICPPPGSALFTPGLTEGDWCVLLRIQDGGANDNDRNEDGTIFMTGGVGVALDNNLLPVAEDDTIEVAFNSTAIIDVLANDSDPDADELTVTRATGNFGSVIINPDSTLLYEPNNGYVGTDVVSYILSDGQGGTASANVNVTITANRAPGLLPDSVNIADTQSIEIDVLANDVDVDGDALTITEANAEVGMVSVTDNNTLFYVPVIGFTGIDIVTYTVQDTAENTSSTTVSVMVDGNLAPLAENETVTTAFGTAITIDVLSNDSDPDGDTLTITAANVDRGEVSIQEGSLLFIPLDGFSGNATITYTISDGLLTADGTVTVTVLAEPNPTQTVTVNNNSSGGGGAINSLWLLVSLMIAWRRRQLAAAILKLRR